MTPLVTDGILAFGSLGATLALAFGLRLGFRRGREAGDP
jgi:hypothetical protein